MWSRSGAGRDSLLAELKKNLIAFDVRKLQVGDFLWVARDKTGEAANGFSRSPTVLLNILTNNYSALVKRTLYFKWNYYHLVADFRISVCVWKAHLLTSDLVRTERFLSLVGTFGSVELVLDYIVERKRMDDLAGSIIDGRFSEQKVMDLSLLPVLGSRQCWQRWHIGAYWYAVSCNTVCVALSHWQLARVGYQ